MSSVNNPLGDKNYSIPNGQKMILGIVVSEWNDDITGALLDGCIQTLKNANVEAINIQVIHVPGTYELPSGASLLLNSSNSLDAIICLGCVIQGETKHDDYINHAVANGLMQLSMAKNKPVIYGVVTTNDHQQALDRAGGKYGNKGVEAAQTALKMINLYADSK